MELSYLLDKIKLTKYEKAAYLALYRLSEATSKELCKESDVPYGRIYDILIILADKGLVSVLNTSPKTFRIIDPKIALSALLEKEKEELEELRQQLKTVELPIRKPLQHYGDETIILKGKANMQKIKDLMTETAAKQMLSTHFGFKGGRQKAMILRERSLRKGIKEKLIVSKVTLRTKPKIKRCLQLGSEIRLFPLKGLRLVIKDEKEAIVCIVDHKTGDYLSVYTKNRQFAESLSVFFNSIWEKGTDIRI